MFPSIAEAVANRLVMRFGPVGGFLRRYSCGSSRCEQMSPQRICAPQLSCQFCAHRFLSPQVLACSATEGTGIPEIWAALQAYQSQTLSNGFFSENRRQQAGYWLRESLEASLRQLFYGNPAVRAQLEAVEPEVLAGRMSPFAAAQVIMSSFGY